MGAYALKPNLPLINMPAAKEQRNGYFSQRKITK